MTTDDAPSAGAPHSSSCSSPLASRVTRMRRVPSSAGAFRLRAAASRSAARRSARGSSTASLPSALSAAAASTARRVADVSRAKASRRALTVSIVFCSASRRDSFDVSPRSAGVSSASLLASSAASSESIYCWIFLSRRAMRYFSRRMPVRGRDLRAALTLLVS